MTVETGFLFLCSIAVYGFFFYHAARFAWRAFHAERYELYIEPGIYAMGSFFCLLGAASYYLMSGLFSAPHTSIVPVLTWEGIQAEREKFRVLTVSSLGVLLGVFFAVSLPTSSLKSSFKSNSRSQEKATDSTD